MSQTKFLTLEGLQHLITKLYARGFSGMGLSQENFTKEMLAKLNSTATTEGMAEINARIAAVEALIEADKDGAINKFNEIVAFLDGIADTQTLAPVIADVAANKAAIAQRYTKTEADAAFQPKGTYLTEHQSLAGYAKTADYAAITDAEIDSILAAE